MMCSAEGTRGISIVQDNAPCWYLRDCQPAASLPYLAKQNGAKIIEINIEKGKKSISDTIILL